MLDSIGFDAMKARGARALLACCKMLMAVALLAGCKAADQPNPVESKNGYSYIPIDGTAFLIPEKSWLKGYANNATDGSICCIMLHATIPDVQPWSPERNEEMYPKEGIQRSMGMALRGTDLPLWSSRLAAGAFTYRKYPRRP